MLRLLAGRENIDKERFIYDHVRGEALIIVPDQYTLVAEEQALKYTGLECLMDIEIISMSRLGLRVLTEQGEESVDVLDKYGRFMLLTRLIREHADDFSIFRRAAGKTAFTSMLSDFISELKQNECTAEDIDRIISDEETEPLLRAKLTELRGVLTAYEEAIAGRKTDTEDYISMYIDAIGRSKEVPRKEIWIYGYDSITPKFTRAVMELASAARSVNFILSRSDFGLDRAVEKMLREECSEHGIEFSVEEIGPDYELAKSETVRRIESGLWKDPQTMGADRRDDGFEAEDLTVVRAANMYAEAETAAAYIWHLIRDLGYRMRDIQVIANDEGAMHPVIKRVFSEYGLPVFVDSARSITDTAPVAFIEGLMMAALRGMNSRHIMAMLKTGLAGVTDEETEDLENYVRSYHIRGSMWERDFRYGEDTAGPEAFAALNETRAAVAGKLVRLRELAERTPAADRFCDAFREYLISDWDLEEAVENMAREAEAAGAFDDALRMRESLGRALEMLGQMAEIMGDEELDPAEFTDIYTAGLTGAEVGVIPPAADGLSVGTMIRTRPRPVRAAVILGANEGTLPMEPSQEGLFSVDEKGYFRSRDFAPGVTEELKQAEERTAMYRMMAKPSEKIYVSWSEADSEGGEALPSQLIEDLRTLFPVLDRPGRILRDVVTAGWGDCSLAGGMAGDMTDTPDEAMRHLIDRIKDRNLPEADDPLTRSLISWYRERRPDELAAMLDAAADENIRRPLDRETAGSLFTGNTGVLSLSASSIGGYFDCPFRFFVDRGLKPLEERDFSSDSRSRGDVYHECLMAVARRLLSDRDLLRAAAGLDGSGGSHGADRDPYEIIEQLVDEELARISREYRGGLFVSAGGEKFRMERIREVCAGAAAAMAAQLSADSLVSASFEESFGRHGRFEPITLEVDGRKVYVEGKIDRSDILEVEGEDMVRIIDYKTGGETLDIEKVRSGYKMQLMIYLISASGSGYEPAGMFYFNIKDPIEGLDGKKASKEAEITGREPGDIYKLKGRYIDSPGVIGAMPESVLAGAKNGKGPNLSREEYEQLRADVLHQIEKTASGIIGGRIDINPLKTSSGLACTYCGYKAVCRRDREYTRNYARELASESRDAGQQTED